MSRRTLYTPILQDERIASNHVNYCRVLQPAQGVTIFAQGRGEGFQLTFRSEGSRSYLVSPMQNMFEYRFFSNPWPLALKASALTTRLPRFLKVVFLVKVVFNGRRRFLLFWIFEFVLNLCHKLIHWTRPRCPCKRMFSNKKKKRKKKRRVIHVPLYLKRVEMSSNWQLK